MPTPHLDDAHTVFGQVVSGQDVVDAIAQGEVMTSVAIEGDASALLASQQSQIDAWNQTLDKK